MSDTLRTRIAAVLEGYVDHSHRYDLADMLIRELEPELNRHDTGCVCDDCWGDEHA